MEPRLSVTISRRQASSTALFTQRCTDVLEMYVRRHPDLWLWMHRRWRDEGSQSEPARDLFPTVEAAADEQ